MTRPVVVYDGNCEFCRRQVDRLRSWDRRDRFEYVPHTTADFDERFPQLRGMDIEAGMRLLTPEGEIHIGADAVQQVLRRLPPFRSIAWLYHVPGMRRIAQRLYGWIARRRYKLGGSCEGGACKVSK